MNRANGQRSRQSRRAAAMKKKLTILAVLLLVAGGVWGRATFFSKPGAAEGSSGNSGKQSATGSDDAKRLRIVELERHDGSMRNPFVLDPSRYRRRAGDPVIIDPPINDPPEQTGPSIEELASRLVLQAVSVGDDPIAVINDRAYRIGDLVNNLRIVRIEHRLIVVEKDGRQLVIRMRE